jgi:hypothetical protein
MDTSRRDRDPFLLLQEEEKLNYKIGYKAALDGEPIVRDDDPPNGWLEGYRAGTEWAKNNQRLL